jgi:hypothetical protein
MMRRRTEGHRSWGVGMTPQRFAETCACLYIEKTNRVIQCPSCNYSGVGRPIDDSHKSTMIHRRKARHTLPGRNVPYANRVIVACCSEVKSIGRVCEPTYLSSTINNRSQMQMVGVPVDIHSLDGALTDRALFPRFQRTI